MSWSNEVVLEFIELYKREQLIWDPKHPLHKDRSEINAAWQRIQSKLSITSSVVDLKKKKESLMTSFRMHVNKKKTQEGHRITWFAFPYMENFLGVIYDCDSTAQIENEFFDHTYNSQLMNQSGSSTNTNNARSTNSLRTTRPNKTRKSESKYTNNVDTFSNKRGTEGSLSYFKIDNDDKSGDMDEYDLYGQLLAKKLRKLNERQRDVAMHEIDNIMFKAKIENSSQHASYSSSPSPVHRKIKSPVFIVTQQNHEGQFEDENITYHEHMPTQSTS